MNLLLALAKGNAAQEAEQEVDARENTNFHCLVETSSAEEVVEAQISANKGEAGGKNFTEAHHDKAVNEGGKSGGAFDMPAVVMFFLGIAFVLGVDGDHGDGTDN